MAFTLASVAFKNGETIPSQYTCDGADISPPLQWQDIPANTQSFVLIMDDPDAPSGIWDHWVIYNIPADMSSFSENIKTFPSGTLQGKNSWGRTSYGGPCPPSGEHRYIFTLYALDTKLSLQEGATSAQLKSAMKDHVLGSAVLNSRYRRLEKAY